MGCGAGVGPRVAGLQGGPARDGQRHAVAVVLPLAERAAGALHVLERRLLQSQHTPAASQATALSSLNASWLHA